MRCYSTCSNSLLTVMIFALWTHRTTDHGKSHGTVGRAASYTMQNLNVHSTVSSSTSSTSISPDPKSSLYSYPNHTIYCTNTTCSLTGNDSEVATVYTQPQGVGNTAADQHIVDSIMTISCHTFDISSDMALTQLPPICWQCLPYGVYTVAEIYSREG